MIPSPGSAGDALRQRIVAFARDASIEATPHDEQRLPELLGLLRAGTTVHVAHPPRWRIQDVVRVAIKIRKAGYVARPHIVARAVLSEQALRAALAELSAAGVDRILVVAGDAATPAGPFASTQDVLDCGATLDWRLHTVAVAGHPEGHPAVAPDLLWEALKTKQAFGVRTGTRIEVVTQFGFNPHAIVDWHEACSAKGIALPVSVGLAGPAPLSKLLRYAMQCGVGASLRALARNKTAAAGLAGLSGGPEEMLTSLIRMGATDDGLITRLHFYCFGGSLETARWLRALTEGSFDLDEGGRSFTVRT